MAEREQALSVLGFLNETLELADPEVAGNPDVSVRVTSVRSLRDMTGQDFGFVAYADEPERREAVAKWRAWYQKKGTAKSGDAS